MLTNKDEHKQFVGAKEHTFDDLIVSDTNVKAHQKDQGVVCLSNPPNLCGPSLCGKTHLKHSIQGIALASDRPSMNYKDLYTRLGEKLSL